MERRKKKKGNIDNLQGLDYLQKNKSLSFIRKIHILMYLRAHKLSKAQYIPERKLKSTTEESNELQSEQVSK